MAFLLGPTLDHHVQCRVYVLHVFSTRLLGVIDGVGRGHEIEPRSPIVEEEEAPGKQLHFNRVIEQQGHRIVLGTYMRRLGISGF